MTLTSDEVTRVRSLHVRLDMAEVEEIYLPLSRLLSLYVAATQRLFRAQQNFLGTEDTEMPSSSAWRARSRWASRPRRASSGLCWRAGRMFRRSISSPLAAFSIPTSFSSANA
jgi:hypothetical protein